MQQQQLLCRLWHNMSNYKFFRILGTLANKISEKSENSLIQATMKLTPQIDDDKEFQGFKFSNLL